MGQLLVSINEDDENAWNTQQDREELETDMKFFNQEISIKNRDKFCDDITSNRRVIIVR